MKSGAPVVLLAGARGDGQPLHLRDGDSVALGFKVRQDWSEQGGALIDAITASLQDREGHCSQAELQVSGQRTRPMLPSTPTVSSISR